MASAGSAGPPHLRHEVRSGPGQEALAAYGTAVTAMKARPDSDHTSWAYQGAMHGTHQEPLQPLWDGCKHYSWFFLPWHRMYVYYFEEIARAAIAQAGGPPTWALPYWNYELGGEHASIPDAFRQPATSSGKNPLYVQERREGINEGQQLDPAAITSTLALARPNFVGPTEFGGGQAPATPQFWEEPGELEETPHNAVHGQVGGRGGWMNDPDLAAQDPIFWLHHAQIDRLWARWNRKGRTDPTAAAWANQTFEFFDVNGQPVSKRCADVLDTLVLGYQYDQLEP